MGLFARDHAGDRWPHPRCGVVGTPQLARPFYVVWYGVTCALGFVTGNTLLAAVFFLLVTPTGWVRRLLGKPTFAKTFDRRATTYWRNAPQPDPASRYYRQF